MKKISNLFKDFLSDIINFFGTFESIIIKIFLHSDRFFEIKKFVFLIISFPINIGYTLLNNDQLLFSDYSFIKAIVSKMKTIFTDLLLI